MRPLSSHRYPAVALRLFSGVALHLLAPLASASGIPTHAEETVFDSQLLQSRNIDSAVADTFRQGPRFLPGDNPVALTVNGSGRGRISAHFDNDGQLCADAGFQKLAGLASPPGFTGKETCFDLRSAWPQTELQLDPGERRVDLVVPPQAVVAPGSDNANWQHGGVAGLFNYDAQYMGTAGSSAGVNFTQLDSEAGFNAGDWIVRSRQTLSRFNGTQTLQHQAAYAQRSFVGIKKVFQTGQISLANSLFGTGQVLGAQLFPETALTQGRGGSGLVESIADSQSVVEVRQSGVLLYRTTVPAGPFRLQGFSLLNTSTDLAVTLTGSDGGQRQFSVPASAFLLSGNAIVPGWSFGVGKMDQQGSSEAPWLGTAANGWQLTPHTRLNAGVLASSPYRAGGVALDSQVFDATQLSLQGKVAQDNRHAKTGVSLSASLSRQLTERISAGINTTQQTLDYQELSDALQSSEQDTQGRTRSQYGANLSWAAPYVGNLSIGWAQSNTFDGARSRYLRAGWSRQIAQAYLGLSLERNTRSLDGKTEDRAYLTLSIPFGSRSLSASVTHTDKSTRSGLRYSDRSHQDWGWSLSADHDSGSQRSSGTGSLDWVTRVSQFSGSLTRDSNDYSSWSARASGGVVAHGGGVTLSPYRIGDTFGIARVGREAGIRLDTPAGPTWTDSRGYAVLPSLSGYQRATVQVDTRSLPKSLDIGNAWQDSELARGAVGQMEFEVVRTRRVLISLRDAQGTFLPHGAALFDSAGNFVTVVGNDGAAFLPDAEPGKSLDVQNAGQPLCSLRLALPEQPDNTGLYETAAAVCR
ncbi:fimbria/pilus outer membrane usher protein [Serratia proteamaculans]|uniref:fimbria/pilus outer membrane usher protein n=1 Tax=Serratia proteamaculans TaxID=28151 RepID=UPI002177A28F|nr:fimbria/pilus outer membrane usher protein [Serratia proteamaculans]CAI1573879.1 Heat shock protein E [Serratia proteamaculans]